MFDTSPQKPKRKKAAAVVSAESSTDALVGAPLSEDELKLEVSEGERTRHSLTDYSHPIHIRAHTSLSHLPLTSLSPILSPYSRMSPAPPAQIGSLSPSGSSASFSELQNDNDNLPLQR